MNTSSDYHESPETSDEPKVTPEAVPVQNKDSARYCWVCFATDDEDRDAAWVQPCNCRGTTKWVCIYIFILL